MKSIAYALVVIHKGLTMNSRMMKSSISLAVIALFAAGCSTTQPEAARAPTSYVGPAGATGATGAVGARGETGATGATGTPMAGATGARGAKAR
jgi:hypothetical protein